MALGGLPASLRGLQPDAEGTRIHLGWGQYVQYPEISLLTSPLGAASLLPIRSNQAIAAIEQRLARAPASAPNTTTAPTATFPSSRSTIRAC
jgi:hypothetical protein